MKQAVYIIDGIRTPIGNPFRSLNNFTADQLASITIEKLLQHNSINKESISEIIIGNAVSAGTGQNLARQASILAGVPDTVNAYTVNQVCGSGLQALLLGSQAIQMGEAQLSVVGGSESATHCPGLVGNITSVDKDTKVIPSLINDGLFCQITEKHMGELVEEMVGKYNISREEQDAFSLESHQKANQAQSKGILSKEIVPVKLSKGRVMDSDDRPRKKMSINRLKNFPPAFKQQGSVTAGNSSVPCDGAAALLISSKNYMNKYKLKPKAKLLGSAVVNINPKDTFESAVLAVKECLKKTKMSMDKVDLFEIGESFAAQALWTKKQLDIPSRKMNIFGGDVAFGHPLGTAGMRILVTLLNALEVKNKRLGMACICFGGGGSIAVLVEKV